MSERKQGLRPEARSVWLDRMTVGQERAFGDLVRLIEAATFDLPDEREWEEDPTFDQGIDPKQVSRLLFLGGGRGSGKTTVARTLLEAFDPGPGSSLFSPGALEDNDDEDDDHKRIRERRKAVKNAVESLQKQVIPLEPLGLADTPSDSNILSALLARIEGLLFPRLASEDVRTTTGDRRQHDAILDLLRLQTDVALAWNGNLKERRGNLDPDNYAMEEMRVERIRLQLRSRFETVLRRTARETLDRLPSLFLLIVDDADADPERLIELLERLRMVAVPELLILLVGDLEPVEAAFRLYHADRYRQRAPRAIGMADEEMSALTNLIARSAFRKHLPNHQRVMLPPRLRAKEAMDLFPLRRDVEDIKSALQRIKVPYPPVPRLLDGAPGRMTLEEFIFPPLTAVGGDDAESTRSESEPAGEHYWYVGSRLLADSPRIAVDMWYALFDARAHDDWGPLAAREGAAVGDRFESEVRPLDHRLHTYVRRLALERLDANSKLWRDDQTAVSWAAGDRLVRHGDLTDLELRGEHCIEGDRAEKPLRPGGDREFHWSRHHGLAFTIGGMMATRVDVGPLVLAEDLAALEDREVARRAVDNRSKWTLDWVVAKPVDAGPGRGGESPKPVPWRIPRYRTTRQIEQFGHEWNAYLASRRSDHADLVADSERHGELVRELADAWIAIHTRVLVGEAPDDDPSRPLPLDDAKDQLVELMARVGPPQSGDWARLVAADWLRSVEEVLRTVGDEGLHQWLGPDRVDRHHTEGQESGNDLLEAKIGRR